MDLFIAERVTAFRLTRASAWPISYNVVVLPKTRVYVISRDSFYDDVNDVDDVDGVDTTYPLLVSEYDDEAAIVTNNHDMVLRVHTWGRHGTFGVPYNGDPPTLFIGKGSQLEIGHQPYRIYVREQNGMWSPSLIDGTHSFIVSGPIPNIRSHDRDEVIQYIRRAEVPTHIGGMMGRPFDDVDIVTQ